MSDKEFPQILADDVKKINVENEDVLLITLPEKINNYPTSAQNEYTKNVHESFLEIFKDKNIKIIVIPAGMKVEIIKNSDISK